MLFLTTANQSIAVQTSEQPTRLNSLIQTIGQNNDQLKLEYKSYKNSNQNFDTPQLVSTINHELIKMKIIVRNHRKKTRQNLDLQHTQSKKDLENYLENRYMPQNKPQAPQKLTKLLGKSLQEVDTKFKNSTRCSLIDFRFTLLGKLQDLHDQEDQKIYTLYTGYEDALFNYIVRQHVTTSLKNKIVFIIPNEQKPPSLSDKLIKLLGKLTLERQTSLLIKN